MRKRFSLQMFAVALFVLAVTVSGFCQQEKGDSELGMNGAITISHSDPGNTSGDVTVSYGYYFTKKDLVGFDTLTILSKDLQDVFLQGRYRHLFPTGNPKIFPFVGAAAGVEIIHTGGALGGGTQHPFVGTGEAGVKFFVSQRTALEIAYNLQYIHNANGSFADNSQSLITFGFTHIFGGHH
ncbi:MAG TPA: hypothetical protein VG759_22420 [Candidatus Angelobacter sp.]|jgi:hypothetical protein|nr:hypothetical protein [Candidatus Angelobacter sp.]